MSRRKTRVINLGAGDVRNEDILQIGLFTLVSTSKIEYITMKSENWPLRTIWIYYTRSLT